MLDVNRFAAAATLRLLPGLPALPRAPRRRGATVTDLERTGPIEVAAAPSVAIRPRVAGNIKSGVVVEVTLRTRYADELGDLSELRAVAAAMLERFKAMSGGPYSSRQLAAIGHPYGRDKGVARRVPRGMFGRALGSVRSVRGSVPSLTVINRQSGELQNSWNMEVERTPGGAVMRFINDSLPAYLLPAGTARMLEGILPQQISGAWHKEISLARARRANEQSVALSLGISK